MSELFSDIRFAVRSFLRTPGFLAVAVTTLALGIGANTAIFSVVNGVLLRPLSYPEPDRLVRIGHTSLPGNSEMDVNTLGNVSDWRARSRSFESMASYHDVTANWTGEGDPERVGGVETVGSIFDVLGLPPLMGRTYTTADDKPGREDIVVLSYGLWQQAFGGDDPIGHAMDLNGRSLEVVGVMPPSFTFPNPDVQFWMPGAYDEEDLANRTEFFLRTIARLAPGASLGQARDEMALIAADLRVEHPQANEDVLVAVVPAQELMVRDVRQLLVVLMVAVGLVLVITCLNLANLLLSRAARREQEIAVRTALGASRGRLIRQLLVEGGVLAALGGAAGLFVGVVFLRAIVAWLPGGLPRVEEISVDPFVLMFTGAVAGLSALVFAGLPAFRASKSSLSGRMRRSSRSVADGAARSWLVIGEVALAVVLLAGAGLMTRSFVTLASVDPGYESESRLTFRVALPGSEYDLPGRVAFFQELEERINALPGVISVGFSTAVPGTAEGSGAWLNIVGRPLAEGVKPDLVRYRVVTPAYLTTMGTRLVRGRLITAGDGLDGTPSVVVNQTMADEFFPGEEAIGAQITLGPDGGWIPPSTIVGIVQDSRLHGLAEDTPAAVFGPHALMPWWSSLRGVVHAALPPEALTAQVRTAVSEVDSSLPVYSVDTVDRLLSASLAPQRNSMTLLGLLSAVALVMAAVGVFGVLSFAVTRRTREIGIRMALGADAASVRRVVVRDGMSPVAIGLALGLVTTLVVTRFMEALLFNVSPTDPIALIGTVAILVAAALLAVYLPARRATRVDPVEALGSQ